MRNFILFVAGFILFTLSACQNDELGSGEKRIVSASLAVQLPEEVMVNTRGAGDGTQINRCVLEVYLNGALYLRSVQPVSELKAKFDIRLVTSLTYDFVFWADHVTSASGEAIHTDLHYSTADLRAITQTGEYHGSSKDDTRDAFFANKQIEVTNAFSANIDLYRPFGQLNIKTDDLSSITLDNLKPKTAKLAFKGVYTGFNTLTGEPTGNVVEFSYQDAAELVNETNGDLTADYLFTPSVSDLPVDMILTAYTSGGAEITRKEITNVPLRRNFQTNVSGNLLTAGGTFNVSVTPAFGGTIGHKVDVENVTDVTAALEGGATSVKVINAPTAAATISLPKYSETDVTVTIELPATTQDITIDVKADEASGKTNPPALLSITAPSASKLVIEAPQTTVTLNGQQYTEVVATTAPNTLIVGSGVEVGTLTLKQGNVKLYGKVASFAKDSGWNGTITRCVSCQADVDNLLADQSSGYGSISLETLVTGKLDFKNTELNKCLTVKANAEIENLNIRVSTINALALSADNVNLILRNAKLVSTKGGCRVVLCDALSPHLEFYDSEIIALGVQGCRGINLVNNPISGVINSTYPYILLDNTSIRYTEVLIGNVAYSPEQIIQFTSRSDSRGINYSSEAGGIPKGTLYMKNGSSVEGFFYALNFQSYPVTTDYVVNIDGSRLDGRAALNVWSKGNEFNVTGNSELVGRNYFEGTTEVFAAIVLNKDAKYDAEYNLVNVTNSKIYSYNTPQTATNLQYSVDLRSSNTTLNLKGSTELIELGSDGYSPRLPYLVANKDKTNKINVGPEVKVTGMQGAVVVGNEY